MIEKLMNKVADSQAFSPDDGLGRMVKEFYNSELDAENLDLVYAANMDNADYAAFLKLAKERDRQSK